MSTPPARILLVCAGNICRSAYGEVRLVAAAPERGLDLAVRSRGLRAMTGAGAPPLARAEAAARGLDLSRHLGLQLTGQDLTWADEVLAMEAWQVEEIEEMIRLGRVWEPAPPGGRVTGLWHFLGDGSGSIPDPYRGGPAAFARMADLLDRALDAWLQARYGPAQALS